MGRDSRNNNKKKCSWLLASASTLVDSAAAAHLHCHAKGWRCRHVMRVIDRGEKCTAAGAAPQPTHALRAAYPSRKTPQQLNGGSRVRAGKRLRMLCFKHLLVQQRCRREWMQKQVTMNISFYCCCASRVPSFNTETLIVRVKAEEERNSRWTPPTVGVC